jgi:putative colanic acid biosynthesis UDP-glucose lipid carrier transferase
MLRTLKNHRIDLVIADLLIVNLGLLAAISLSTKTFTFNWESLLILIISNGVWVVVSLVQKIYKWKERLRFEKELPIVWITILSYFSLFFILQQLLIPSLLILSDLINYFIILMIMLPLLRLFLRKREATAADSFNYIIVGGKATNIKHIFKSFKYAFQGNANCIGRFGNTPHDFIDNIGGYQDLKKYIKENNNISKLYYIYSQLDNDEVRAIMQICQTKFIDFEIIPRETDLFPRGVKVEFFDELPVLLLKGEPLFRLRNKIIKRLFDIIFSSLVLLLIFPWLLPIIAILIKLESKGPVFFIQDRSGYKGGAFPCFKFRTMTVNQDSDNKQATKNDNRITKVGAFLRKTSLDEFPQFINVFLGQMSVVGPRPHMLKHTEDYSKLIDIFMVRHQVKPGITGWAQVNGYRGPTEQLEQMENRVKFDVWYIENWSFWLDIRCIFYTVFYVFKGEENAF